MITARRKHIQSLCVVGLLALAGCESQREASLDVPDTSYEAGADTAGMVNTQGTRTLRLGDVRVEDLARLRYEVMLTIGTETGVDENLLDRVRSGFLADQNIWIANGGTSEIREYGRDGGFLKSMGGNGDAPGEFRFLARILPLSADSLVAFDARNGRVTVFGPGGDVGRTFIVPWSVDGFETTELALANSTQFFALVRTPRDPRKHQEATMRDSVEVVLLSMDGQQYSRTGVVIPDRWWTFRGGPAGFTADSPPDGPSALFVAATDFMAASSSAAPEIKFLLGRPSDVLATGPALLFGDERESQYDGSPRSLDHMVSDHSGRLWIGQHSPEGERERRWFRIDGGGNATDLLNLPSGMWLLDAEGSQLLVRSTDSLGVQRVHLLSIHEE